ncbi:MAG: 30S ribosomal protein S17 [Gammaproteobacteria bacterium]|nr:30S ribosomal protein S17 [Gammaproteobacteria bacterium]NND40020.1 30S ribosomal protein S17 [Pseudomonadales bacterium]MBT8149948.1 30S ribosomal protein S17 [Gammaproteobacteria bacterium]NNL10167.1 30S ribosomal protein S17 [Pseudomonadales bacterium]NNM11295.1 30S ribosomal protein S17 [Pseudomonadales bacterium]
MAEQKKTVRRITGKVISDKMDKTITVLVERRVKHPLYGKYMTRSTKLHAHDEKNECNIGDMVAISESRPLSKTKTWMLQEIVERAVEI